MRAAILTDIMQMEIRDVPEPQIQKDTDVLLQVEVVGVCGSDIHYYRTGRIGDQVVEFPFVVGHECSARVLAIGSAVTGVQVGQRVAVDPLVWCHQCDQCLAGRENTCRNQTFLGCPGQMAGCLCERLVMPEASCFPMPDSLSAETVALLEPFTIGYYAAQYEPDLAGKRIAILGSGPIGLCVAASAKAAGAAEIFMTDIRNERREFASTFGATWTGNPNETDVVADILAACPEGVDTVFEAAGQQATCDQGVAMLKPGAQLNIIGIPSVDRISFEVATMRRKELTIQNVRRQNHCVEAATALVASGQVNIDPMMTHHFSLDQSKDAFDLVEGYRDGVIKAMVHIAD